jgi:DNA-binding response OmpR family regulator
MTSSVLIVDDDEGIRFFASFGLTHAGWEVHEVSSGEAALAWLEDDACDVVLLDLHMAGIDGLTVMREITERWPEVMIIIMTAFATIDSAIEAVRRGAFDYLQKPCRLDDIIDCVNRAMTEKEKLDRQRQLVRQAEIVLPTVARTTSTSPLTVKSGALTIELGSHTVFLTGKRISLTPTEYGLLKILGESPGQPVSVDQLITEGLGYKSGDPQAQETLRVHISRLRRKLSSDYILTIRGGGYALANLPVS